MLTVLQGSFTFQYILPADALTTFILDFLFKVFVEWSDLKNRDGISLHSRGQATLLPIIKDSESLSSGYLSWNITYFVYIYHWNLFASLCRHWGSKNPCKCCNELSLVPDSGLSSANRHETVSGWLVSNYQTLRSSWKRSELHLCTPQSHFQNTSNSC